MKSLQSRVARQMGRLELLVLCLLLMAEPTSAHTSNESYLTLHVVGPRIQGRLDVARRDLQQRIALSGTKVRSLNEDELLRREEALAFDILSGLEITANGRRLQLNITDFTNLLLNGGEYARILFEAKVSQEPVEVLELNCAALCRVDPSMHGLIQIENGDKIDTAAYTANSVIHRFTLTSSEGKLKQCAIFVLEGIRHIWRGFDHLLFLVALLVPSVLRCEGSRRTGIDRFRPALINVFKIVTAFTVPHSITLSLVAFGILNLPVRLVETAIAASVIIAATNNLYPWFQNRGWVVAFTFGLIHGFGFTPGLGDLGLINKSIGLGLIGFNVGVEIGQLAIVTVFLPIVYSLRRHWWYQFIALKVASVGVIAIAVGWMAERLFDLELFPF